MGAVLSCIEIHSNNKQKINLYGSSHVHDLNNVYEIDILYKNGGRKKIYILRVPTEYEKLKKKY